MEDSNTANILSVLDAFTMETSGDIAMKLARDFRQRRIEKGVTREQIARKVEMASGGDLSEILKSLEKSDLISSYYNFGETKRNRYFKLTDPFCLFYLNFVLKHPTSNKSFWQDNQFTPKVNTWRGLAFEDVCFVHQEGIRSALGIRGVQAEVYPWRTGGEGKTDGAQIDMLIDRGDDVINVCEMKYYKNK